MTSSKSRPARRAKARTFSLTIRCYDMPKVRKITTVLFYFDGIPFVESVEVVRITEIPSPQAARRAERDRQK